MKTVFIDTNVLLEYIRDSPLGQAAWALGEIEAASTEAFIPGVCAGELLAIRERSDWGPEKRAIQERLFRDYAITEIAQPRILLSYARIQCWTQGVPVPAPKQAPPPKPSRPMGKNDLWIAATVHASGGALLTADKGFLPLDGIWFPVLHCSPQPEPSGRADRA